MSTEKFHPPYDHACKYVIIGNSAGGIGAIEAIRQVDKEAGIIVISDEKYIAYSRPLIAEYLAGEKDVDQILYRPADFYEKRDVHPLTDAKVEKIDLDMKQIILEDKERVKGPITYEKLLIATGGTPFVPPMKGVDMKGIHTFMTLDDAKGIRAEVDKAEKVLVVGGGLIGICVTEALVKLGKRVTIVELLDRVLSMNLDKLGSNLIRRRLYEKGVELITGNSVESFVPSKDDPERVGGAELKMGMKVDCDLVIVAIGVRPRIELVKDTKVKVDRGIVVDRHMETSAPDVFACGDVAEAYDFVWGENRLSPIWPNAYLGGRVAGLNMAGKDTTYEGSTGMTSFTYFGLPVVSAGMHSLSKEDMGKHEEDQTGPRYEVLFKTVPEKDLYKKFVLQDGVIKGMIMVTDIKGAGVVTDLMRDKVDVSSFKQSLLEEEFGIVHLPKDMIPSRLRGEH